MDRKGQRPLRPVSRGVRLTTRLLLTLNAICTTIDLERFDKMKTNELLSMAESLPIEIKIQLIDTLLNSMHPSQPEIDELWSKEAERRVDQIKSGEIKTISGEEVFNQIQNRFSK